MSKGIDVSWGDCSKPIWIFLITESENRCFIPGTCRCLFYKCQSHLCSNHVNVFRAYVPNKSCPLVTNRVKQELTAKPISLKCQLGFCSIPIGTHSFCEVTSDCLSFEYLLVTNKTVPLLCYSNSSNNTDDSHWKQNQQYWQPFHTAEFWASRSWM